MAEMRQGSRGRAGGFSENHWTSFAWKHSFNQLMELKFRFEALLCENKFLFLCVCVGYALEVFPCHATLYNKILQIVKLYFQILVLSNSVSFRILKLFSFSYN